MNVIRFQTKYLRYEISSDGQNVGFLDIATGQNRVAKGACAKITLNDRSEVYATGAARHENVLALVFSNGTTAEVLVDEQETYITFTLQSVSNDDFLSISFVNIELDDASEAFVGSLLSMTLSTQMQEHPGDNRLLIASGYPRIGLFSTKRSNFPVKAAVIGAPVDLLRGIQREVLDEIPDGELPKSRKGGPYADLAKKEAEETYTIFSETVSLDNVDSLIADMKRFAVKQINIHHYGHYIQGDFRCYEKHFPNGAEDLKKVVDRFHQAGILVGLQTYAFLLGPKSRYITPVPHRDVDTTQEFILQEDISADDTILKLVEDTPDSVDTFGRVSWYYWVDDELIKISRINGQNFEVEQRGFYDTVPAAHKKGARVRQIKLLFGFPCAKAGTELFYEVARNTAEFYNALDADMFYIDAIDGAYLLEGEDYVWYHAVDFVREIFAHLKKDPIFDCCYNPQYNGTWFVRTRYGAMDTSSVAHRRFMDAHVNYNREMAERMGVTPELGWVSLYADPNVGKQWQTDIMYPEDLEYICAKAYGTGACMTHLEGFHSHHDWPLSDAHAEVVQKYDALKSKGEPSKSTKAFLREPDNAAYLNNGVLYKAKHIHGFLEESGDGFSAANPFEKQVPSFRLQALCAAGAYDSPNAVTLLELDETVPVKTQNYSLSPMVAANGNRGLGVWCKGDGSNAIVCIKLKNGSAEGEHFIRVSFTGWKYFAFYENQNEGLPVEDWPRRDVAYTTYRELGSKFYGHYRVNLNYEGINGVDIVVKGSDNICLKSLRLVPHIEPAWENPTIHFGDTAIRIHTKLKANTNVYFDGKTCKVTDYKGIVLEEPSWSGNPMLCTGKNDVSVTNDDKDAQVRAKLTVTVYGDKLQ